MQHLYQLARWEWDYKVKKKPYTHEDAVSLLVPLTHFLTL